MDIRLLDLLNEVLREKGYDVGIAKAVPLARAQSHAARETVLSQAAGKDASTGRPISETHGIAKTNATYAAAGGGAKSAGGGGIAAGLKNVEKAGIQAELTTYGITAAAAVIEITAIVGMRYLTLKRRDKIAARDAAAELAAGAVDQESWRTNRR